MASDLTTQLLPFAGVLTGAAATLMVQWINLRSTLAKDQAQRLHSDRQERKAAIVRFLDAAQRIEHLLAVMRQGGAVDQQKADEELHAMWLTVKEVVITCAPATGTAADEYCEALYGRARRGVTDSTPKRIARWEFLDAARVELGQERYIASRNLADPHRLDTRHRPTSTAPAVQRPDAPDLGGRPTPDHSQ